MNLMKSRFGGLGMRPRQLHIESSSDPKPLYGGISLACFDVGSALYVIASKLSREQKTLFARIYLWNKSNKAFCYVEVIARTYFT